MSNYPFISVIVPVYNTALYLNKCIESILSQKYNHFELILVDDGSTDGSSEICDQFQKKDNRIKVFHKERTGVSDTRNIGLEMAKGDWIGFIDSDDWIEVDYLNSFIPFINDNILCVHSSLYKDFSERTEIIGASQDIGTTYSMNYVYAFNNQLLIASSSLKLFSRVLLQKYNLRYDIHISTGEDRLFVANYLLLDEVKGIKIVKACYYHYVIHVGSITTIKPEGLLFARTTFLWFKQLENLNCKYNIMDYSFRNKQRKFTKFNLMDSVVFLIQEKKKPLFQKIREYRFIKRNFLSGFKDVKLPSNMPYFFIENCPSFISVMVLNILLNKKFRM